MCERSDAVNELRRQAECLSRACEKTPLQQVYDHILNEEVPERFKRLLDRLQ
jgi:NADH:ubiquinone oxidoreductase subunit E